MTERLSKINEDLQRKMAARNEFDQTIQETEAAYYKVRQGGTRRAPARPTDLASREGTDFGEQSDTAASAEAGERKLGEAQADVRMNRGPQCKACFPRARRPLLPPAHTTRCPLLGTTQWQCCCLPTAEPGDVAVVATIVEWRRRHQTRRGGLRWKLGKWHCLSWPRWWLPTSSCCWHATGVPSASKACQRRLLRRQQPLQVHRQR